MWGVGKSLKLPADLVKTPKTRIDPSTVIDIEAFVGPLASREKTVNIATRALGVFCRFCVLMLVVGCRYILTITC